MAFAIPFRNVQAQVPCTNYFGHPAKSLPFVVFLAVARPQPYSKTKGVFLSTSAPNSFF